jgi:hypothetical protein
LDKHNNQILAIPVTEISYGPAVGLAASLGVGALMVLTKSKNPTSALYRPMGTRMVVWATQWGKSDFRGILTGLDGVTGRRRQLSPFRRPGTINHDQ